MYKFWERVHTFDFDYEKMLLAVGIDCKAIVFSLNKCMEEVYSYISTSTIKQVKLINNFNESYGLVLVEADGVMSIKSLDGKASIEIKTPDAVSSFCALNSKSGTEISFATRQGVIGWCSSNDLTKMNLADPIRLQDNTRAIKRLWLILKPPLIICIQFNTIYLYERDQHNCLCIYKSLTIEDKIQAVDLIDNTYLAYSIKGGKIIVLAANSLEQVTVIETSLPE